MTKQDGARGLSAFLSQGAFIDVLFRDMPEAAIFADRERRILRVNPAAESLLGYREAELVGLHTAVIYAERADYEHQGRTIYNAASSVGSDRYRITYRRKSGETFPSVTIGSVIRDAGGAVVGFLGIIRDISAQVRVELSLQDLYDISTDQNLDETQKIDAVLALGTQRFDLPLGVVGRIEGDSYTVERAVSPRGEVQPGTMHPLGRTYSGHTVAVDQAFAISEARVSPIADHTCYRDFGLESYIGVPLIVDGARYGVLSFAGWQPRSRPFDDTDSELIRIFAQWIAHKLLARARLRELGRARAAAEALREQAEEEKAFNDHVISNSPDLVVGLSVGGTTQFMNPAAERATGYSAADLIGRDWWSIMYPGRDYQQVMQLFAKLRKENQVLDHPMTLTRADGTRRTIAWTSLNRHDAEGNVVQLIGYGRDATAEREILRQQQQEAQLRSLGEMAGGMAHEINNALQPVIGLVGLMRERVTDYDRRLAERMDMLEQHALYARKIVSDVLAFARKEGPDTQVFQVTLLLAEVTDFVERITPSRIRLEPVGFPPDTPRIPDDTRVRASRNGLIQVIQNLVSNAMDAMGGRGTIRIALSPEDMTAGMPGKVRIEVTDPGTGMDEATRSELFKPFFSTQAIGKGTGLGLSVVHGLVAHWGGDVRIDSAPDVGTTVAIVLPTVAASTD